MFRGLFCGWLCMLNRMVFSVGGEFGMFGVFVVNHVQRSAHSFLECSHVAMQCEIVSGVLSLLQKGHVFCICGKMWCSWLFVLRQRCKICSCSHFDLLLYLICDAFCHVLFQNATERFEFSLLCHLVSIFVVLCDCSVLHCSSLLY